MTNILAGHQRILDDMRPIIHFPHHEIHKGYFFSVTVDNSSATSLSLSFKTPKDTLIHMSIHMGSESASHMQVNEDVTIQAESGTETSIINRNRYLDKDSEMKQNKSGSFVADNNVLLDATMDDSGTTIEETYYFNDNNFVQGRERKTQEFVLKEDTEYEYKLISDDGAKGLEIQLNWYEVQTD